MAAPQTHLVATGGIRFILLFVFRKNLSFWQWISLYFWGVGIDLIDHFTSPSYVKDFVRRGKRILAGKDDDGPAKDVKMPLEVFHIWIAIPLMLLLLAVFNLTIWAVIVFIPWFVHVMIDRYQRTPKNQDGYLSFFHPWMPKWRREKGYPVKSQKEIRIFTLLAIPIAIYEFIWFIQHIF